jgi:hypothetical protein
LFTQTFAAFIGPQRDWHLPGAPMLVAALLLLLTAMANSSSRARRCWSRPCCCCLPWPSRGG